MTLDQFNELWKTLARAVATGEPTEARVRRRPECSEAGLVFRSDEMVEYLERHGLILGRGADGRAHIRCPGESEHTPGTGGKTSTTYIPAGGGYEQGHFVCLHAHCHQRTQIWFLNGIGWTLEGFEVIDSTGGGQDEAGPSEQSQRSPYHLLTMDELAARPAVDWRIKWILPKSGLTAVYGPSGSGKGFLVIDIGMTIASGLSWFGLRVKAGPVVYCALEGEEGIPQRVAAYRARHTVTGEKVRFILQPFSLLKRADVNALAKTITDAECGDGVTILDTLNRAAPGCDEKDMGRVIAGAKALQMQVGGLVLLVHHTGKDLTKGLRGHSSLHAALDAAIEVTRAGENRTWCIAKSKDGRDGSAQSFRLGVVELGKDKDGDLITSCVVEPQLNTGSQGRRAKIPPGGNQKIIWQGIRELLQAEFPSEGEDRPWFVPVGRSFIRLEDAVLKTRDRLTCAPDQRTRSTRTAITALVNACLLELKEGLLWEP